MQITEVEYGQEERIEVTVITQGSVFTMHGYRPNDKV